MIRGCSKMENPAAPLYPAQQERKWPPVTSRPYGHHRAIDDPRNEPTIAASSVLVSLSSSSSVVVLLFLWSDLCRDEDEQQQQRTCCYGRSSLSSNISVLNIGTDGGLLWRQRRLYKTNTANAWAFVFDRAIVLQRQYDL